MIDKLLSLSSKKIVDDGGINKAILDAVVSIGTRDKGNILFLISDKSYKNYSKSKDELRTCLLENKEDMSSKQRTNSMDMSYSIDDSELTIRNTVESIKNDFAEVAKETETFDRLIFSVFTKSRAELDEVAIQCLSLKNINIYIV